MTHMTSHYAVKNCQLEGCNTTTEILDKLCEFFEVQVGEVARYVELGDEDANVKQ